MLLCLLKGTSALVSGESKLLLTLSTFLDGEGIDGIDVTLDMIKCDVEVEVDVACVVVIGVDSEVEVDVAVVVTGEGAVDVEGIVVDFEGVTCVVLC